MRRNDTFAQFVAEQMACVDGLRIRAMFGGHGVYQGERMFAIITDGRLYLKADTVTRSAFEAHGLAPFTYVARGKTVALQYFEAPPEVFEDPAAMASWARLAMAAALRGGTAPSSANAPQRAKKPLTRR